MSEEERESVLIVGGGIAGITAALNVADYGYKAYLVDDTPSIGGLMARLDKTFPTNDCSICIEAPLMYEVNTHDNIQIVANADVRKVDPVNGHFKVRVLKRAIFVDEEKCTACGKCVEACPVTIPDELDARIGGTRKLISVAFPQAVPNINYLNVLCRTGKMRDKGACVGACVVDCSQCRECGVALCVKACRDEGKSAVLLWQKDQWLNLTVKSIIVATGVKTAPLPVGTWGLDVYPNVIDYMELRADRELRWAHARRDRPPVRRPACAQHRLDPVRRSRGQRPQLLLQSVLHGCGQADHHHQRA